MPRLSLGLGIQTRRKIGSGGSAPITTSRAFNSSGVQVGSTNTGDIPISWLENESTVTSVIFANNNSVTSIGQYAFKNCTSLANITIPNGVTSIGGYAFQNAGLTSITIPNSVGSIGDYAFSSNASLTNITIGTGVTSIGGHVFEYCTNLTSVTFTAPSSVTSIGSQAFYQCSSITSVTIPNSVTSIENSAFEGTSLTSINIPNGVIGIASHAFRDCANLATVLCRVPQSAFIGSGAFYGTASPLVIQARITDTSWTAGVGLTFQGNTNVTVIKTL